MPLISAWEGFQGVSGGRGIPLLQQAFGTYDHHQDPLYQDMMTQFQLNPTPQMGDRILSQFGDHMDAQDYRELASYVTPIEGTPQYYDFKVAKLQHQMLQDQAQARALELEMLQHDIDFQTGLGAEYRDWQARRDMVLGDAQDELFLEYGIPHEMAIMDITQRGAEFELDAAQDLHSYQMDMAPVELAMAQTRLAIHEADFESARLNLEYLPDLLDMEMAGIELSQEGQRINNEFNELKMDITRDMSELERTDYKLRIDELRNEIKRRGDLHPLEMRNLSLHGDMLEAQLDLLGLEKQQQHAALTYGGPLGELGTEPREMTQYDQELLSLLSDPELVIQPDGTIQLDQHGLDTEGFGGMRIRNIKQIVDPESGFIRDFETGHLWLDPLTNNYRHITELNLPPGVIQNLFPEYYQSPEFTDPAARIPGDTSAATSYERTYDPAEGAAMGRMGSRFAIQEPDEVGSISQKDDLHSDTEIREATDKFIRDWTEGVDATEPDLNHIAKLLETVIIPDEAQRNQFRNLYGVSPETVLRWLTNL